MTCGDRIWCFLISWCLSLSPPPLAFNSLSLSNPIASIWRFSRTHAHVSSRVNPLGLLDWMRKPTLLEVNISACWCSSADGNYEVTLMTKATVYFDGRVIWEVGREVTRVQGESSSLFPSHQPFTNRVARSTWNSFRSVSPCNDDLHPSLPPRNRIRSTEQTAHLSRKSTDRLLECMITFPQRQWENWDAWLTAPMTEWKEWDVIFRSDIQHCEMKFGSWTYSGEQVDLVHINQTNGSIPVYGNNSKSIDFSKYTCRTSFCSSDISHETDSLTETLWTCLLIH